MLCCMELSARDDPQHARLATSNLFADCMTCLACRHTAPHNCHESADPLPESMILTAQVMPANLALILNMNMTMQAIKAPWT